MLEEIGKKVLLFSYEVLCVLIVEMFVEFNLWFGWIIFEEGGGDIEEDEMFFDFEEFGLEMVLVFQSVILNVVQVKLVLEVVESYFVFCEFLYLVLFFV